jgi:hypothetical protein
VEYKSLVPLSGDQNNAEASADANEGNDLISPFRVCDVIFFDVA